MSSASERASGQANGPILTSQFLAFLNHCALLPTNYCFVAVVFIVVVNVVVVVSTIAVIFFAVTGALSIIANILIVIFFQSYIVKVTLILVGAVIMILWAAMALEEEVVAN